MSPLAAFVEHAVNLSALELERRTWQFVRADLLAEESSLYQTKWWDYRPLHPLAATYRFTLAYHDAYVRAYAKRKDVNAAKFVNPLKENNFLRGSTQAVTGFWRARQFADRLGTPYDFYCTRAMEYAAVCDWPYLPQPHILYSSKSKNQHGSMLEFIVEKWDKAQESRIFTAESDFYRVENFIGNIHQIEHQRHLVRCLEKYRGNKVHLADLWVNEQKILLGEVVEQKLGTVFWQKVKQMQSI